MSSSGLSIQRRIVGQHAGDLGFGNPLRMRDRWNELCVDVSTQIMDGMQHTKDVRGRPVWRTGTDQQIIEPVR